MDARPNPDNEFCVRWEDAGGKEPPQFITIETALDRLTRGERPADRDKARMDTARMLDAGKTIRTPFAYYTLIDR